MDAFGVELVDEAGERIIAEKMVALVRKQMRDGKKRLRGQHAKETGCVKAKFIVASDLPEECRYGVFRNPGADFDARVRFSNAQGTIVPDKLPTGRGAAIKLLKVEGPRAIPNDTDPAQDFLMVNHPAFPFGTPAKYLSVMRLFTLPLVGEKAIIAYLLKDKGARKNVRAIRAKWVGSPLETKYWSGSPYWLGSSDGKTGQAVKYSLVHRTRPKPVPESLEDKSDHYLKESLIEHLTGQEAKFDFKVQFQTDPRTMKIEDAAVAWDEDISVPVTVATLHILPHKSEDIRLVTEECEAKSFTPWHALAEHRPLGGINRLRRLVYEASVAKRQGK